MPATRRSSSPPSAVGTCRIWSTVSPSRAARPAGTIVAPPSSSAASAASRSPATNVQPAVVGHVGADDRGRVGARPVERDVEGGDRADPGDARDVAGQVGLDAFVLGDRPDRGHDELARDDVGDPAGGRGAGVLADAAEGDDHRQPDGQAAEGQRRAAAIAHDRAAREALLEAEQERERRAGDPGDGGQHERDEQGGDEQDRVDDEGLDDAGRGPGARQDDDADERDDDEHGGQPAQPGVARGRQVEPRPERLDRLDAAGAAGRLEGGGEGHADPDERAR